MRDKLRDQVYDAMAEKKEEKDQVEEKQSEDKKMNVDGENALAGEDKCDAVKEGNKSEDDKGENKEGGRESDEEEEAAEGDDTFNSLLKLWIFKLSSDMSDVSHDCPV